MTCRAQLVTVAAVLLAACGDDGSLERSGEDDAELVMDGALQARAGRRVGGTVSGLAGTGLVLELNGDETLAVQANGRFHFEQRLSTGAAYTVTVRTQPTSVVQTCAVSSGAGVVGRGRVNGVSVTCSPTGTFVGTGSLALGLRWTPSATRLPDGQVLVAGGFTSSSDECTPSAELYDPVTGTFAATGSLNTARHAHSATLLPDGKVLIAGGTTYSDWSPPLTSAELYDPSTGSFTPTGSMSARRAGHTATLLTNGEVLVVGGYAGDFLHYASAELYDPATGTFTDTGSPALDRYRHAATRLEDGKVLVVGGVAEPFYWDGAPGGWPTFAELYDPATATFSGLGDLEGVFVATLLADGRVLIAGSSGGGEGAPPLAFVYDPATQQFEDAGAHACIPGDAALLTSGAALLLGWACAEIYDPRTLSFAPTDTPDECVRTSATSLVDGDVLITCSSGGAQLFELLPPLE